MSFYEARAQAIRDGFDSVQTATGWHPLKNWKWPLRYTAQWSYRPACEKSALVCHDNYGPFDSVYPLRYSGVSEVRQ